MRGALQIVSRSFWMPKKGNGEDEYEDAFFPLDQTVFSAGETRRWAVADGASESMLSGPWAQVLVRTFCQTKSGWAYEPRATLKVLLAEAIQSYSEWLYRYLEGRRKAGKPVQWYEEPGLEAGAYSTLLGLEVRIGPGQRSSDEPGPCRQDRAASYRCVAVGDSCLFVVRDGRLLAAHPIDDPASFGNRPALLSSREDRNSKALAGARFASGNLRRGDLVLLATDALAAWFLKSVKAGDPASKWEPLVRGAGDFRSLVEDLREHGQIRNDDVTLVSLEVI